MASQPSLSPPSARAVENRLSLHEPAPLDSIARLPSYPWLVVVTTCIGVFIGQLDATIVQLALPVLEREFHSRLSAVSWVAIADSLAFAAILPAFSRMSEIFGRKVPSIIDYAAFAISSALCGTVSNLSLLIALRVVQGIGGALVQQDRPTTRKDERVRETAPG